MNNIELYHGDCLDILPSIKENSIDLIATDPPYFKVKNESWDRAWDTASGFLAWLDRVLEQFQRVLKPNGSLYMFASPRMSASVEVLINNRFNVLNSIIWIKEAGWHKKAQHEIARLYFPKTERIVFAEHKGADNYAKGEAGYSAKCDELRGFVFEPLRLYLKGELEKAGLTPDDANIACDTASMAGRHFFSRSQWCLPTKEHYLALRKYAHDNNHCGQYFCREYEDLRREYEDLRRPFNISAEDQYTDVWNFTTVANYPGKHPCEKPLELMEHIVRISSKPGAVVLDAFMGSGTTGEAARNLGRDFIGIDMSAHWVEYAERRLSNAQQNRLPLFAEEDV